MADYIADSTQEVPFTAPPRAFRLCVIQGEERATRTLHRGMTIVIGSSQEADLSLTDPTVSARHCEVSALAEGLLVKDLKSKNGLSLGAGKIDSFILRGSRGVFTVGQTRVVVDAGPELEEGGDLGILGGSEVMQRIRSEIRSLAPLRGAVLISGESGTGKDLVARALHEQSGRPGRYCPLNVAALSESLLDAELFGHEKGAFTGAAAARRGLFEVAHQGTLFLDEIAELSPAGQAKLLRVVEDGHVRAVGAEASRTVNVRLVSATCKPLGEQITRGAFREDLFHRLAMLEISLPPLRKRTEDIPLLARHYLSRLKPELGEKYLDPAAEDVLRSKPWKGNIRELFGTLYRVAALTDEDILGPSHFGPASQRVPQRPRLLPQRAMELLDIHGSVSAAARAAGVPRTTFRSVLERRGLR